MKADKTHETPEIEQLLQELGNSSGVIPFYAIFPGNGGSPIAFGNGPITQSEVLEKLSKAALSQEPIAQTASAQMRE